eukprot:gene3057-5990_t
MFRLPAFISCAIDFISVFLYFNDTWLFVDTFDTNLVDKNNPFNIDLLIIIFAGLRIILFLPYMWQFQQDRRLHFASFAYLWHVINVCVITFKAVCDIYANEWALSEWLLLLGSTISVLSQIICLNHLKSTALPERHVVLGFSSHSPRIDSRKSLLGHESGHQQQLDDNYSDPGQASAHMSNSTDFLNTMRSTFDTAKKVWNHKVDRLKQIINGEPKADEYQSVFDGVLLLFTGRGADAVKELEELYQKYPDEVEFYIPQLVVFLIYGSFETSGALQAAVQGMCRRSAIFAHRVYWFIVAFCLSGAGVTKDGVVALKQLLAEIESTGEEPARKLSMGQGYGEDQTQTQTSSQTQQTQTHTLTDSSRVHMEDASCHSDDAVLGTKTSPSSITTNNKMLSTPASRDFIAVDVKNNNNAASPSAATSTANQYPLHLTRVPQGCDTHFAPTLLFWDKMTEVSRSLLTVPRESRTEELRLRLAFAEEFLPSATIYAPF